MSKFYSILILLVVAVVNSKGRNLLTRVTIQNLNDNFTPKDELDYVNYLKLILGRHDESTKVSEPLVQIAADKKYSDEKVVQRVVIAFIPNASEKDVTFIMDAGKTSQ